MKKVDVFQDGSVLIQGDKGISIAVDAAMNGYDDFDFLIFSSFFSF
jgi:hypothetical protein